MFQEYVFELRLILRAALSSSRFDCSIAESMIFTATPNALARGSVRTTSPWHLSTIVPSRLRSSTEKWINSPSVQLASDVQKYTPDALTSRVIPWAFFRNTGNAVRMRWPLRLSKYS
jgi:hypothetical protein